MTHFILVLVGQANTPPGINWDQIGAGALIAAPAWAVVFVLWRAFSKLSAEFQRMLERVVPLLAQSVDTLAQTPDAVQKALQDAQGAAKSDRLDAMLTHLEQTLREHRGP